ncbi:hypothetical protein D915_008923 [Fasciola hepatica]|uniref:RRM domain-containing protein n=1 Tax=Fasciola hepatica TaxID=6192 RepID=A0A4E0RXF8_FASHE|nr:hypothetical protein D915_008923 [Fasciola hepatica]
MNRNSHGRFRGSCLLQFDSPDDCCTVRDACRGRQIEGRPLRCNLVIKMDVKQTNTKSEAASAKLFGLKVKGVPTHIDESELRALFNQHKLIEFRCAKDSNEGTRTILLKFKSRHDQRAALNAFHQKTFFGVQLCAKIWCEFDFNANEFHTFRTVVCQVTVYRSLLHFVHRSNLINKQIQRDSAPHRRKRGQKKNKSQSPSSSNNAIEPSSLSHSKKRRWTDEDEPENLDPTASLDDAAAKKRKSKKKRLDLDESDASQLGTVNTPHIFPSKKLKDKHFDVSSINSTFSAGTKTTPRPKTLKKRKSLAV